MNLQIGIFGKNGINVADNLFAYIIIFGIHIDWSTMSLLLAGIGNSDEKFRVEHNWRLWLVPTNGHLFMVVMLVLMVFVMQNSDEGAQKQIICHFIFANLLLYQFNWLIFGGMAHMHEHRRQIGIENENEINFNSY